MQFERDDVSALHFSDEELESAGGAKINGNQFLSSKYFSGGACQVT